MISAEKSDGSNIMELNRGVNETHFHVQRKYLLSSSQWNKWSRSRRRKLSTLCRDCETTLMISIKTDHCVLTHSRQIRRRSINEKNRSQYISTTGRNSFAFYFLATCSEQNTFYLFYFIFSFPFGCCMLDRSLYFYIS